LIKIRNALLGYVREWLRSVIN